LTFSKTHIDIQICKCADMQMKALKQDACPTFAYLHIRTSAHHLLTFSEVHTASVTIVSLKKNSRI
jgi:selenocysteine lyase/cysteine desulfurase